MLVLLIFLRAIHMLLGLSDVEKKITKSLVDHFEIRHCILCSNTEPKLEYFKDLKLLSSWDVSGVVFSHNDLFDYFMKKIAIVATKKERRQLGTYREMYNKPLKILNARTMIIFQVKDLGWVDKFFREKEFHENAKYFTWIIFHQIDLDDKFKSLLSPPYNTEVIVIKSLGPEIYELIEIYAINKHVFSITYGKWIDQVGLKTINKSFYERRKNTNGSLLLMDRVGFEREESIVYGFHQEIIRDIMKIMSFKEKNEASTLQSIKMALSSLFTTDQNVKNSLLKPMKERATAADKFISIVGLTALHADLYGPGQSGPIFRFEAFMYIKQPQTFGTALYFILPFDLDLWLCLIIFVILITILATIFHAFLIDYEIENGIQIINSSFWPIETFCNQSGSDDLKNFTWRIANITVRLLAIVMIATFSGELSSHLTHRSAAVPFENIKGLMKNGEFRLGCNEFGYEEAFFRKSTNLQDRFIYDNYLKENRTKNISEGLEKICKGNYAHLAYDHEIRVIKTNCSLFKIKHPVVRRLTALKFAAATGFIEVFSYRLLWFYSSGIIQRMQKEIDGEPAEILQEPYLPVEMHQMKYLLAILIGGIVISVVIITVEVMYRYLPSKSKCFWCSKKLENRHDFKKN